MVHAHEIMRTDFILADLNDTVSELIGQMERHDDCFAVVFDNTTYKGIASKKWLLSSRINPAMMKLRNIMTHRSKSKTPFFVPKLTPETDLKEIARLLTTADIHALPVIITENKKEKVVGMVHAHDVLKEIKSYYSGVRADELASTKLITIQQDEELGKAIEVMNRKGIGHLVVVNDNNKLIGIIGLTDILTEIHTFPRKNMHMPKAASHQKGKHTGFGVGEKTDRLKLPVHNILTHVPNCCTAESKTPIATIIDTMLADEVSSVILAQKDIPIGIITIKDILEDFAKP